MQQLNSTFWPTLYTVFQKNWCQTFGKYFINCQPILKILLPLETALNYLQKKYNTSRRLLKTLLYYPVKHKSFKMLQLLRLPLLDDKTVNFTILKII